MDNNASTEESKKTSHPPGKSQTSVDGSHIQAPLGVIPVCAFVGGFFVWALSKKYPGTIPGGAIAGGIGGGIGSAIGQFIRWLVVSLKRQKYLREADQMKLQSDALPQTLSVGRVRLGGFATDGWVIVLSPDSVEFRPRSGKTQHKVSRANAHDAISFENGLAGRYIYLRVDDHSLLFRVRKPAWKRLRWWVYHNWGQP